MDNFTGREEELARLDRWATDREVRLIGVTAWGGAGKTALVTQWLRGQHQPRSVRGIFGWSFYENPSAERWANELLAGQQKLSTTTLEWRAACQPGYSNLPGKSRCC